MRDRGTIAVAMSAMMAVVAVLAIAVTAIGVLFSARTAAQTAADSAALAAAVATYPAASQRAPEAVARAVAEMNGADLHRCSCAVDPSLRARTVEVTARIAVDLPVFGRVTVEGTSRAEFDPKIWLGR